MDNRYLQILLTPVSGNADDRYPGKTEERIKSAGDLYESLFEKIFAEWMQLRDLEYEESEAVLKISRLTADDSLMNQSGLQEGISALNNREKSWLSRIKYHMESIFTDDQAYALYGAWDPNRGWDPKRSYAPVVKPKARTQIDKLLLWESSTLGLQKELRLIRQAKRRLENEKNGLDAERVRLTNDLFSIAAERKIKSKEDALKDFVNHINSGDMFINRYGKRCTVTGKSDTFIFYRLLGQSSIEKDRSIPVDSALATWKGPLEVPKPSEATKPSGPVYRPKRATNSVFTPIRQDEKFHQTDVELLEWEVLPIGWWDNPRYLRTSSEAENERLSAIIDRDRLRFVGSLGEHKAYAGSPKFGPVRYYVFVFESRVVAECPNEGNAIYVIEGQEDWQNLLGRSKGELRRDFGFRVRKLTHKGDWKSRLKNAVQG